MYFDTHLHLTQLSLTDFPQSISSNSCGLNHPYLSLSVSVNLDDSLANLELAKQYPNIIPAVGLHPWFVDSQSFNQLDRLFQAALSSKVKVMGEIGLDFSKKFDNHKLQLAAFTEQLSFAQNNDLAISIHLFKAYDSAFNLLKKYRVRGVLHGFAGGYEQAKRFIGLGYLIGVNGVILRENAVRYHRLVKEIDLKYLVLETDAPNISIKNNSSDFTTSLKLVAQQVADLKNLPLEKVLQQTYQNSLKVFNIDFI